MDQEPGRFPAPSRLKKRNDILGETRSFAPDVMTGNL
jgi:hypothetical protein